MMFIRNDFQRIRVFDGIQELRNLSLTVSSIIETHADRFGRKQYLQ